MCPNDGRELQYQHTYIVAYTVTSGRIGAHRLESDDIAVCNVYAHTHTRTHARAMTLLYVMYTHTRTHARTHARTHTCTPAVRELADSSDDIAVLRRGPMLEAKPRDSGAGVPERGLLRAQRLLALFAAGV